MWIYFFPVFFIQSTQSVSAWGFLIRMYVDFQKVTDSVRTITTIIYKIMSAHAKNIYLFFSLLQNIYMDNRKTVLELKDVPPPPPHHTSSSQSLQPFPLPPLPLLPPCLPPPQLSQDPHQQQQPPPPATAQQQHEGASPKVSICVQCDYCRLDGYGLSAGRGVVGGSSSNIADVSSVCMSLSSVGAPTSSSGISRSGPCSVTSSVCQYKHSLSGHEGEVLNPSRSLAYKPQPLSSVATSQPVSSHPYLACCPGVLRTYPSIPLSIPSLFTSSAPLAPSLPCVSSIPASVPGSCLASPGYYPCGVDCCPSARRSQRSTHGDHPTTTTITTTTTSAHFCSNPMHLNVEHTVCLKGAHYCRECILKVGKAIFLHM